MFKFSSQRIPCQVLKKGEDKESTETVEGSKVKEEKLEVAGGKCWRQKWQSALSVTGEIFKRFPMKVIFESFEVFCNPKYVEIFSTKILIEGRVFNYQPKNQQENMLF